MKTVLILHGWYQNSNQHWLPWLKKELRRRGYKVFLPDLPTMQTDLPSLKKQILYVEKLLHIEKETVIFGHSLGAVLGLRLAMKHTLGKLFLVAGWDFDDLTKEHRLFWKSKIDHPKIKKNVKEIYCISSDNDPYFTAFTVEEMSKRLGGKFILIKSAGHFTDKFGITKIPQLLKYIN